MLWSTVRLTVRGGGSTLETWLEIVEDVATLPRIVDLRMIDGASLMDFLAVARALALLSAGVSSIRPTRHPSDRRRLPILEYRGASFDRGSK